MEYHQSHKTLLWIWIILWKEAAHVYEWTNAEDQASNWIQVHLNSVLGEMFGHYSVDIYPQECSQVQPVTCWYLSVWGALHRFMCSKTMDDSPDGLERTSCGSCETSSQFASPRSEAEFSQDKPAIYISAEPAFRSTGHKERERESSLAYHHPWSLANSWGTHRCCSKALLQKK